jgi:hypothetical protein
MKPAWMLATSLLLAGSPDLTALVTQRPHAGGNRSQNQIVNETTPTAVTVTNPCNADLVALTGQTHTVIHITQASSGNYSADVDVSSTYTGLGAPSGLSYQGSDTFHDQFLVANPLPFEETILEEIHLRSQTNAGNYTLRAQFHFTVNANGVLTADVENPTTRCDG